MRISWYGKFRPAFIKFLGYYLNYLKSGVYIIVFDILKSSDY